jgi:molybdate transport system regulatory protein
LPRSLGYPAISARNLRTAVRGTSVRSRASIDAVRKQTRTAVLRVRIDLVPGTSLGPGKIALLAHIAASGSLSQAARDLGMSYRRGWMLLDDLNQAFSEPVTTASIGGAGGGGARLTPFGQSVVDAYRTIERESEAAATRSLAWLADAAKGIRPPATSRRPLSRPLAAQAPAASPRKRRVKRTRDRAATRP